MKTTKDESAQKTVSIATLLFGIYMIVSAFRFASTVLEITGRSAFPGIGILIVSMSFVLPVLLLLIGICGVTRKTKAGTVFSIITIVLAFFSIIVNLTSSVFAWDLLPAVALPVLFIGYTRMAQNRKSAQ